MSETTGQEAPAIVSETPNPEAAQDQNQAASPEADTQAADGSEQETAAPKTFTQAELDEILQKRLAKAEAKAERRVLRALESLKGQQPSEQPRQSPYDVRPTRVQGESDDAFVDRLTDWKLDQRDRASNQTKTQAEQKVLADKTEKMYAEAAKIPGFDRVDFDELPLTSTIAEALIDSTVSAKLMAHLSANPDECERIAALKPARQAAEIGKLEDKLASAPRTSKAPAPITPVGQRGSANSNGDPSKMSMDEYIAWRKKDGARWAR